MTGEQQNLSLYISVANFVLTWGVALYMYLSNKNKATNERIGKLEDDLDDKLDTHAARIGKLEGHVGHAPTHEDLAKLHEKMNAQGNLLAQVLGELKGVSETQRLMLSRIAEKGMP